ncbi:MAG: hypothetical protein DWQ44_01945 [Bacteroidetes bacterium]|nr:MAG: hypothetical protein DWQ33_05675 [Bacteroidota bacterium]REK04739.1 MAG: hypothetical protein DWQ39_05840 [Bacteroidota bacterium]REK36213.1 MAG: hypothetical protein DWQ44_01945 [Bacteroidota bacterium]
MSIILHIHTIVLSKPLFSENFTWFLIFTLVFVLAGLLIYFHWVNKKFRNENRNLSDKLSERTYQVMLQKWELERKNLAISQQNQDILDGMRYARNIQFAVLPKEEKISRSFSDHFVLYKPKDIVSGDFYFYEDTGPYVYLAAADCTGHGVAGAFMAMVGSSLLHQITGQQRAAETCEILDKLNEGIIDALRQKDTDSHGGMDIALIRYDKTKSELCFSGANRPLVLIRNYNLETYPGSKLSLGGFNQNEQKKFDETIIPIKKDDRIYLFTDGFADQFGGPAGKKIMTKNFKEILYSIHENPMNEQKATLEGYYENWKGRLDQIDDILVIGIKF